MKNQKRLRLVVFLLSFGGLGMAEIKPEHGFITSAQKRMLERTGTNTDITYIARPYFDVGMPLRAAEKVCSAMGMSYALMPKKQNNETEQNLWCSRILKRSVSFAPSTEVRIILTFKNEKLTEIVSHLFDKGL